MPAVDANPVAWATDVLRADGVAVHDVPAVHAVQAWSSVWTLSTDAGRFWLKAGRPGDGAVEVVLASLVPDLVVATVAAQHVQGWLLTRDGGPPWRPACPTASALTRTACAGWSATTPPCRTSPSR